MQTYAWPANIAKDGAKWITSVVDWPNIASVGNSAQDSLLAAMQHLSDAIRDRISNDLKIPLPSELKPGQVQIPIDNDATARLEAYLERIQEKRLRRLSEIEQANRAKRESFLTEFRTNMEPAERLRDQCNLGAVDFASIAIKATFVMNGGALVALPAILQFADKGRISTQSLLVSVILFVVGIVLATITNFLAYKSMLVASDGHENEVSARAVEVIEWYYPSEDPTPNQAKIKTYRADAQDKFKWAQRLANLGVLGFGLSAVAFIIGVAIIIHGLNAKSNTATAEMRATVESQMPATRPDK